MKKLIALFAALNIIIISVCCAPLGALGKDVNNDEGMYDVTSDIYADAYMLINLDDETYPVIAQKNKDKLKYPASLTKIATAMVAILNVDDLQAKATVSKNAVESLWGTGAQVAGLEEGDELTIEQLLYLTLVYSACDSCNVLAEYVSGSIEAYVQLMNEWCASLGCENTHFSNVDGLHADDHYTTASDLALITIEALKNETFTKIATTKTYEYDGDTFIHTNFMLDRFHVTYYYEYAEGIKTGSTTEAGYCVITKASKNGYNYLAIVLDSPVKKLDGIDTKCSFIDAGSLFDWAFDSLKYSMVIRKNDVVDEIPVNNGKDADTVQLVAEEDVNTLVPTSLDPTAVIIKAVDLPESVDAPIAQGDKICTAEIIYADKVIATVNLVSAKDIELSTFLKVKNATIGFLGSTTLLIIVLVAAALAVAYAVVLVIRIKNSRKRSEQKRRRREQLEEQENREYQQRRGNDDYLPPPRR